jgi:hypothetical protein
MLEKKQVRPEKLDILTEFLNMKIRHVFESYLASKQYAKEFKLIQERDGEKFAVLYGFICKIFVNYYTYSKGNKPKKIEKRIRFMKIVDDPTGGKVAVPPRLFKVIRAEDNSTQV